MSFIKNNLASEGVKKKRKVIHLEEKLTIIRKYEAGITKSKIGLAHGLNESTVRHIILKSSKYKELGRCTSLASRLQTTRNRSIAMIEMERLLSIWIKDCNQKRIPLNQGTLKSKAMSLFELVKQKRVAEKGDSDNQTFCASSGWVDRYRKRSGINNIHLCGESGIDDEFETANYPLELRKIIEERDYCDQQIFNVNHTGLLWKRLPNKAYLTVAESEFELEEANDRVTLLFGGNASGDLKLKPMLVCRSQDALVLESCFQQSLPLLWKSQKNSWITKSIFEDWFTDYFCPEVKDYCESQNLDFKVLLILDNAPYHLTALNVMCRNVDVAFLPPNTSSVLQPMDQGVIFTFKLKYLQRIFTQGGKKEITFTEFWNNYDITNAAENITASWSEVSVSIMRSAWKNIIPHCGNDFKCPELEGLLEEITQSGLELGFNEVDKEDIQEWFQSHDMELCDEDLINMEVQSEPEDEDGLGEENATSEEFKRTEPANTEDETRAQLPIEKGSSIKIEVMDGLEDFNEPKLEAECQSFEASESYLDIPKEAVDNLLSERLSGAVQVSDSGNLVNGKLKTTEFDLFAESIAFQLNNMPVSDALRLQFKIQQVITEFRLSNAPSTSSSPVVSFKKPRRSRKTKQSNSISRKKPSTSRSERMKRPLSSHVLSQEANICDLDIKTEYISDSLMCE